MSRKWLLAAFVATIALMATGCSKAPEVEMQAADQAMQAAMGSDVAQYAPDALRMAEDTLNAAKAAQAEQDNKMALLRSYGATKALYVSAKNLTDQAVAQAEQEKERVRTQVMAMLTQVQTSLDSASAALAKAPTGKDNKAELALIQNDLNSIMGMRTEAQADFDAGRYKAAQTKLETVMSKSQSIIGEIQAAAAKRRR
jgi:hypothetical protein